jgi:hypothetical protein
VIEALVPETKGREVKIAAREMWSNFTSRIAQCFASANCQVKWRLWSIHYGIDLAILLDQVFGIHIASTREPF